MDWRKLKEFEGIDLNDSFILNWQWSENEFSLLIEASIWPNSQYYEPQKEKEYTCYKQAQLIFTNCKTITGIRAMQQANSSTDSDGSIDYGNIDTLAKTEVGFELTGEFGNVQIQGGQLGFEIHV